MIIYMCKVICITNRDLCENNFFDQIRKICEQHPTAIILREKDLQEKEYEILAKKVIVLCNKYDVCCILHTFVEVAKRLHHPYIHVPIHILKTMCTEDKKQFQKIGTSCHSIEDAKIAEALGCTYIIAGHIFPTNCKKGLSPRGISFLESICKEVKLPVYGIGGINSDNFAYIKQTKAVGGCIMSGFMQCKDVKKYMDGLRKGSMMGFQREQLLIYGITERSLLKDKTMKQQVEEALIGGATLIQLREKNMSNNELLKEAKEIKEVCHKYHVPLIINDHVEVAIACGADGVHVGQEDMEVEKIRQLCGDAFIIGATAKTIEQAQKAEQAGANYLGVGAVFASPTKKNAKRITKEEFKAISNAVNIPIVAIGGITYENVDYIKDCGVAGVAVVSAIFGFQDVTKATKQLKKKVKNLI